MASPQDRPTPKKPRKVETWEGVAIALLGAIFFAVISSAMLPAARDHDFVSMYSGGLLVRTNPSELYNIALQDKVQLELAPNRPTLTPFVRPGFSAFAYALFALMPFKTAFVAWLASGVAITFAIWFWAMRRFGPEALVYCAFFVPLGIGIAHGQDIAFVTGLLLIAYLAIERGRTLLGGFLLALLLVKFNLFLLVPVVLLARREWRILTGYVSGALALAAVSVALASPQSYLAILTDPKLVSLNPSPEIMFNVHAIATNFGLDFPIVRIALMLGVLGAALMIPRSAPVNRWFWAAVGGGMLISPHTYGYDSALMLPAILGVLFEAGAVPIRRWIAVVAVMPFPYFMTLLPMPFSAIPALLMTLIFLVVAQPGWFGHGTLEAGEQQHPVGAPA